MQDLTTDEMEELKKDLPFFNDDWEPSPEDQRKMMEDHLRELENKRNSTMLYNPADKKRRNYKFIKKKYGKGMADKMLHAKKKNNGRLDSDDYADLMRRHHQNTRPKDLSPKSKDKHEPFIKMDHKVLRSAKVRKALKKSMMLYLYVRCFIVREKFKGDRLNLYERYFRKGKLAASVSIRKLSRDLFTDRKTITSYISELEKQGVIEVEMIKAGEAWDSQDHNIYVFGSHDFNGQEIYLVEEIANIDQ